METDLLAFIVANFDQLVNEAVMLIWQFIKAAWPYAAGVVAVSTVTMEMIATRRGW